MVNVAIGNKDAALNTIATTSSVTVSGGRMNSSIKKSSGNNENLKSSEQISKNVSIVTTNQSSSTFSSVRGVTAVCVGGNVPHESTSKSKDYSAKKFSSEIDSKMKNYHIQSDYKESSVNSPDYKPRNSTVMNNLSSRYVNQSVQALHRENHGTSSHHSRPASRNDNTAFAIARKALEQQNSASKMTPINFPPLRAPQSIVNVRHPFVTEARTKHNEIGGPNSKTKLNMASSLQSGMKDLDHSRQTFHSYGTSQIAGIPNVQNLGNVTANMSPYPRPDSFPQPTVASVLFPDTSQFPQSPPFSTTQIGQLNQYQTYDPGSFATTPVNVNPVIPQFSAESSIPYPQYDNTPQFVQPNHYPTADIANSQYQYQAAGVGQLQDSPMFIQSLQSPIAVTDQYAAPNYARTVRTELIPRLRRPPRFNK
ncbi:hypothetical protein WH47_07760 [Habropoda laboriosa]|uniref:Uncharacterized protein n=1 Tax=Habropoda laboriosa TaxID=597456 RepID=A0A0L7QNI3_9HYME|nr:PREDICTED: uncharacterized protein LOC108576988 [Habropoda laboriosa]KOC60178.1 hypothetical protein WH47_07760 [Habropoda laboriosa]